MNLSHKIILICFIALILPNLAMANPPIPSPAAVITGTLGQPNDPPANVTAVLGRTGVLLVRSQARWDQLQKLLAPLPFTPVQPLPKIDFASQSLVFLYDTDRRPTDTLTLEKFDLAATPPQLNFFLTWDNAPRRRSGPPVAKFILALIPTTPTAKITLSSEPINADRSRIATEFSAVIGDKDGGDIVDGLQAAISPYNRIRNVPTVPSSATSEFVWIPTTDPIKPKEDIRIALTLHLAKPGPAKPEQFGTAHATASVWNSGCAAGYRNFAFFVTTPDGKTTLLRPALVSFRQNINTLVDITADKPCKITYLMERNTLISLQALGLDTSAPGTYTITALYEEDSSTPFVQDAKSGQTPWHGSLASNTVTVQIKE